MIPFKDNIPADRPAFVTLGLITANVIVYVIACAHGGSLWSGPGAQEMASYGAIPSALTVKTMFTSMFIQGSLVQLVGNMLFLWLAGKSLEDAMGAVRFLGVYVIGGLLALALQVLIEPHATSVSLGAAGAVATVIGGYVVLYHRARILALNLVPLFWGVTEVPVVVLPVAWLVMQAAFATGTSAYLARLGALVIGGLVARPLATHRKPAPPTAAAYR